MTEPLFEVTFRGMNSHEAERAVPAGHGEHRAWMPAYEDTFECYRAEAVRRYDELLADGIAGREVDGVIPHVVAINELRVFTLDGEPFSVPSTVVWQYTDPDETPNGPWTKDGTS